MMYQESDISSYTDGCLSGWQLDQYELGVLSSKEVQQARAHIEQCESCAQKLQERRQDAQEMIAMPGFDALLAKLSQQSLEASGQGLQEAVQVGSAASLAAVKDAPIGVIESKSSVSAADQTAQDDASAAASAEAGRQKEASGLLGRGLWRWLGWGSLSSLSAAAVAALLLVFQMSPSMDAPMWLPDPSPPHLEHRSVLMSRPAQRSPQQQGVSTNPQTPKRVAKSARPVFGVVHFHKGKKYSQWTRPREQLQPGDLIQFAYQLPKTMHVMIASINELGEISVFFPLGGRRSAQLSSGAGTLPHEGSLELDDYLGKERILIASSPKPIAYHELKAAIQTAFVRAGRDLAKMPPVSGPWHCQSLLIRKTKKRPGERKGAL